MTRKYRAEITIKCYVDWTSPEDFVKEIEQFNRANMNAIEVEITEPVEIRDIKK